VAPPTGIARASRTLDGAAAVFAGGTGKESRRRAPEPRN
jgi:hypothetical protein